MDKVFALGRLSLILSEETSLGHLGTSGGRYEFCGLMFLFTWRLFSEGLNQKKLRKYHNFIGTISKRYCQVRPLGKRHCVSFFFFTNMSIHLQIAKRNFHFRKLYLLPFVKTNNI